MSAHGSGVGTPPFRVREHHGVANEVGDRAPRPFRQRPQGFRLLAAQPDHDRTRLRRPDQVVGLRINGSATGGSSSARLPPAFWQVADDLRPPGSAGRRGGRCRWGSEGDRSAGQVDRRPHARPGADAAAVGPDQGQRRAAGPADDLATGRPRPLPGALLGNRAAQLGRSARPCWLLPGWGKVTSREGLRRGPTRHPDLCPAGSRDRVDVFRGGVDHAIAVARPAPAARR